jgi:hypothetical protein
LEIRKYLPQESNHEFKKSIENVIGTGIVTGMIISRPNQRQGLKRKSFSQKGKRLE